MSAAGDQTKLVDFFRTEYFRAVAYVRRLIDDAAERDGEDIVQDVFLNVCHGAGMTRPIENVSAYLYQALRHKAIDYLRRRRWDRVSLEQEIFDDADGRLIDYLPDAGTDPEDQLEQMEMMHLIFEAIESLNENEKAILIETEFEGRSYRELADTWQIPLGTLLSRKSRAMAKIRVILAERDE
jgi:RNA polymerase sigma factor (sigma-70 family)